MMHREDRKVMHQVSPVSRGTSNSLRLMENSKVVPSFCPSRATTMTRSILVPTLTSPMSTRVSVRITNCYVWTAFQFLSSRAPNLVLMALPKLVIFSNWSEAAASRSVPLLRNRNPAIGNETLLTHFHINKICGQPEVFHFFV